MPQCDDQTAGAHRLLVAPTRRRQPEDRRYTDRSLRHGAATVASLDVAPVRRCQQPARRGAHRSATSPSPYRGRDPPAPSPRLLATPRLRTATLKSPHRAAKCSASGVTQPATTAGRPRPAATASAGHAAPITTAEPATPARKSVGSAAESVYKRPLVARETSSVNCESRESVTRATHETRP